MTQQFLCSFYLRAFSIESVVFFFGKHTHTWKTVYPLTVRGRTIAIEFVGFLFSEISLLRLGLFNDCFIMRQRAAAAADGRRHPAVGPAVLPFCCVTPTVVASTVCAGNRFRRRSRHTTQLSKRRRVYVVHIHIYIPTCSYCKYSV